MSRCALVISFINVKGGVGKTTISTNVSHILSVAGYKVLHVDLDPQGSSSEMLKATHSNGEFLTKDDIMKGATAIHNHAYNPETAPSTQSTEELNYINEQSVTKYKKNPLEGYAQLAALLERDVTGYFLKRFEPLFTKFPPFKPVYYITEEGDPTI